LFDNSYYFASCCSFHFPAFKDLGNAAQEAGELIRVRNKEMAKRMPEFVRSMAGKCYAGQFRRLGPMATKKGKKVNSINTTGE
jgi:hypothetical protein